MELAICHFSGLADHCAEELPSVRRELIAFGQFASSVSSWQHHDLQQLRASSYLGSFCQERLIPVEAEQLGDGYGYGYGHMVMGSHHPLLVPDERELILL